MQHYLERPIIQSHDFKKIELPARSGTNKVKDGH